MIQCKLINNDVDITACKFKLFENQYTCKCFNWFHWANDRGDQWTGLLISPKLLYNVKTIHGIMEILSGFGPRAICWQCILYQGSRTPCEVGACRVGYTDIFTVFLGRLIGVGCSSHIHLIVHNTIWKIYNIDNSYSLIIIVS